MLFHWGEWNDICVKVQNGIGTLAKYAVLLLPVPVEWHIREPRERLGDSGKMFPSITPPPNCLAYLGKFRTDWGSTVIACVLVTPLYR